MVYGLLEIVRQSKYFHPNLEVTPFAAREEVSGKDVLTSLGLYWSAGRANRITAAVISIQARVSYVKPYSQLDISNTSQSGTVCQVGVLCKSKSAIYTIHVVKKFLSARLGQYIFTRPFLTCSKGCALRLIFSLGCSCDYGTYESDMHPLDSTCLHKITQQ